MTTSQKNKVAIFMVVFVLSVLLILVMGVDAAGGKIIFIPFVLSFDTDEIYLPVSTPRNTPTPAPTQNPFPGVPTPTPYLICLPDPCYP